MDIGLETWNIRTMYRGEALKDKRFLWVKQEDADWWGGSGCNERPVNRDVIVMLALRWMKAKA